MLDVVADPVNLPRWAPRFAPAIQPDKHLWIISRNDEEVSIRVRVDREHGTVDLLAADQPTRGAFTRVLPNGHGSEYLFTLSSPRRQRRQPSATRWRSSTTNSMSSASSANAIARRQQPLPAPLAEPRGFRRAEARSGYGASTSLDHGATSYLSWVLIHEEGLGPFAERLLTRL